MRSARKVLAISALAGAALVALAAASCSDDEIQVSPGRDASDDRSLFGDGSAPADSGPSFVGDLCGDARGLEEGSPWPLRGGCPKRAGSSISVGPQSATVKWSRALPAGATSPAVAASRAVWVGTAAGDVVVVSPGGVVQGALRTGGEVRSSPAITSAGVTLAGSDDGSLYGVTRIAPILDAGADGGDAGDAGDAGDGGADAGAYPAAREVFALPLGAPIASSPAVASDGTIYAGTTGGELVAVAKGGGAVLWRVTTHDTSGSSPALAKDGTIYVGSSDHHVYALTPSGATKWTYDAGAEVTGSPVVGGDGSVYAGSADGALHALSPDGAARWVYHAGGAITGPAAITYEAAYVGSADKKLHAVSLATGEAAWTYATLGAVASPIVDAQGTVYFGSADGHVYAVTPGGLLFFAVNAKGAVTSAPALSDDGTLYVTTSSALVAVGP